VDRKLRFTEHEDHFWTSYGIPRHCRDEEKTVGHALKKTDRIYIPQRDKSRVAEPRSAEGVYQAQIEKAFCTAFQRYEKAFEALAKV